MSLVKLITESFNAKKDIPIMESKHTIAELDRLILEDTNKLISIKAKYEDLKSTWKSLKEDLQTFSFYNHMSSGSDIKEQFQKAIDDLKLDYKDTKTTLDAHKAQRNKLLLEDTFEEKDSSNTLKDKYYPIFEDLQSLLNSSADIYEIFEYLFNNLVPKYGKAETKAGEIVRALMRIMYGAFRKESQHVFYEGDGKNSFGNAARFLKDMGYEEYLNSAIDLTGDEYIKAIEKIIEEIIRDFVSTQEELFYTENNIDYEQITLKENH